MKCIVLSVTHKEYWMPKDELYMPIQVGNGQSFGFARDNTGINIAEKNKNFCELTALYWGWKNLEEDYIGLDHYRRHFAEKRTGPKKERILTKESLLKHLDHYDVILPRPRHYWIETNQSQYEHAHHKEDLLVIEEIISKYYPEYCSSYSQVMRKTSGHRFNMMIMKKELLNDYCTFLFDILFRAEKCIDISGYSDYDSRIFGFIGERLLDVWIYKNHIQYKELPYVFMEKENWLKKGSQFVKRKIRGCLS